MSLFGDDEDDRNTPRPKSSLFDDEPQTPSGKKKNNNKNTSSIFADADADENDAPWASIGKKQRGVKSLLADADVPELYIDTYDELQSGGKVQDVKQLLRDSGIGAADQDSILSTVGSGELSRGESNVLLALIGLAQEGEELSLDAVDERRGKLPVPKLKIQSKNNNNNKKKMASTAQSEVSQTETLVEAQGGAARKPSFGLDSDPWASPEMHKGHKHLNGSNGFGAQRTTSNFTTTSAEPANSAPTNDASGSWGASNTTFASGNTADFGSAGELPSSADFDDEGNGPSKPVARRPQQVHVHTGPEENVTVNILNEKEGMFMFQHRNYEVASIRRNSKVIRRYSDFVWLLDCLHKRYPFRQLPLLPPKRVAINGNHLAADTTFLEKRRRGLVRFANALVRHPVLRDEQLVVMFLTVPTVDASPLLIL